MDPFFPVVQPLIVSQKFTHNSPDERERKVKKKQNAQQLWSTLENLQAVRFYRFIHQRGVSVQYKNRITVDTDVKSGQMGTVSRGVGGWVGWGVRM